MREREAVLKEFDAVCETVAERAMADEIVRLREALAACERHMIPVNATDDMVAEAWDTLRKYGIEDGPEFVGSIERQDVRGAVDAALHVARLRAAVATAQEGPRDQ